MVIFSTTKDTWTTFIIYDSRNIDHSTISNKMNSINTNLEFKIVTESDQSINYLDMTITRTSKDINIDIYRKPTNSNITVHQNSNHPQDHKDAAYRYYANRMKELPNTKQAISLERIRITEIARLNGYPKQYINKYNPETSN